MNRIVALKRDRFFNLGDVLVEIIGPYHLDSVQGDNGAGHSGELAAHTAIEDLQRVLGIDIENRDHFDNGHGLAGFTDIGDRTESGESPVGLGNVWRR